MKINAIQLTICAAALLLAGCRKDGAKVVDVSFTADQTTISAGQAVEFTIGSGADANAIYTGDRSHDFELSRINLVEVKGYSEQDLQTNIYALRIPDLKEYVLQMPRQSAIPASITFSGNMNFYNGNLVPWDFSNSTKSNYIEFDVPTSEPHTITIQPGNVVLPQMLNLNNAGLRNLGALNVTPNNNFSPFLAFPDGFDTTTTERKSVRFGVQFTIDGGTSPITYFTVGVRELLDDLAFNLTAAINTWRSQNQDRDPKKGISEIKLIINADNPADPNDDGDLLAYKGKVYLQQMRMGSADNMIKAFDEGVAIPYVFPGTTSKYKYTYSTPGTYKATLVTTFIGKKRYNGDGYNSGRANEISASEYEIERRFKTIDIVVQ